MSDANVFYGQCACGGPLTVQHLLRDCPLNRALPPLPEVKAFHIEWVESRLDTSHVAVLGEN